MIDANISEIFFSNHLPTLPQYFSHEKNVAALGFDAHS
jgi:hypothetical protein